MTVKRGQAPRATVSTITVDPVAAEPDTLLGLGERASHFWLSTIERYDLSGVELEVLREACWLLDECEGLRAAVTRDGTTIAGSRGQTRVHPALGELRSHRLALGRLLAQLALPDEDGRALVSAAGSRARTAANARWAPWREQEARREANSRGNA
jgi:hypothetical protein